MQEVTLVVVGNRGSATPTLESYRAAVLPVTIIAPDEEFAIAVGTANDKYSDPKEVFRLQWLSPSGELMQHEGKLPM